MTDPTDASALTPRRWPPALALMVLAPLCAETLPGATRPSAYLHVPVIWLLEMAVWGGGALMARELVRRRGAGTLSLIFAGVALALAEEFVIQQTSIAPLVIRLQGVEYARSLGVNYLYLFWAVGYECVFVVLLPVAVAEWLFPDHSRLPWLSRSGWTATGIAFSIGAMGAWFTWTRIARVQVFHMPEYRAPPVLLMLGLSLVGAALMISLRLPVESSDKTRSTAPAIHPIALFLCAALLAALMVMASAMAFGVAPSIPPAVPLVALAATYGLAIGFAFKWLVRTTATQQQQFSAATGALIGNMAANFVGYIGASAVDFWAKVTLDVLAVALLYAWWRRRSRCGPATIPDHPIVSRNATT